MEEERHRFAGEDSTREEVVVGSEEVREDSCTSVGLQSPEEEQEAGGELLESPHRVVKPDGQHVKEGGLPVVRAEGIQLFGETLFQTFNQRLEQHQAPFTATFVGFALTAGFLVAMARDDFLLNVRERNPPTFFGFPAEVSSLHPLWYEVTR